jgi:hypothetical protein
VGVVRGDAWTGAGAFLECCAIAESIGGRQCCLDKCLAGDILSPTLCCGREGTSFVNTNGNHIVIFNAWQSDSPASTNRNAIRVALAAAVAAIEENRPGLSITVDDATRDMPGADNVPDSIRDKIDSCDIFIGDVTTVTLPATASEEKVRPCPNPNVTYEIGYASARVGWKRMILLINLNSAKFTDLPFDFDRHRVSRFTVKGTSDKSGADGLKKLLIEAITTIVDKKPKRPEELRAIDPAELRRNRDILHATRALSKISLPILEDHIEQLPHTLNSHAMHFYYGFHGVVQNALFHINDSALDNAFRGLDEAWGRALSFGENYHDAPGDRYIFSKPGDAPLNTAEQADWDAILVARNDMHKHLHDLLAIVREHYVEIDLMDTNQRAFDDWRESQAD